MTYIVVEYYFSSSAGNSREFVFSVKGNLINIIYFHCGCVSCFTRKFICKEIVQLLLPEVCHDKFDHELLSKNTHSTWK